MDISPRNCGLALSNLDFSERICNYVDLALYEDEEDRLLYLEQSIQAVCLGKPVVLGIIENYAWGAKFQVPQSGEKCGTAKLTVARRLANRAEIVSVTPTGLKKFCSGYGGGDDKARVETYIRSMGFQPESSHDADAAGLCCMGVFFIRNNLRLTSSQTDLIQDLRDRFPERFQRLTKSLEIDKLRSIK